MLTKRGDSVRPCFSAKRSDTRTGPPLVRARLGKVFVAESVTDQAVRIGEQWVKSWLRVTP